MNLQTSDRLTAAYRFAVVAAKRGASYECIMNAPRLLADKLHKSGAITETEKFEWLEYLSKTVRDNLA